MNLVTGCENKNLLTDRQKFVIMRPFYEGVVTVKHLQRYTHYTYSTEPNVSLF